MDTFDVAGAAGVHSIVSLDVQQLPDRENVPVPEECVCMEKKFLLRNDVESVDTTGKEHQFVVQRCEKRAEVLRLVGTRDNAKAQEMLESGAYLRW
jgi:hypothetical protein